MTLMIRVSGAANYANVLNRGGAAGLTLDPLLALALLPVLLLQLGDQSLVHVPGQFPERRLLFLLCRRRNLKSVSH